jgi:SAM-dependent methyltransferase
MSREEAIAFRPGDGHYSAYVGPPGQWDVMGATQFRLLTALGLREHHRLLDLGCGALRAGRLLIPYLNSGCYFGLEPNAWLVEDGLSREVGADMVAKKTPVFRHVDDFSADGFGTTFDFIVAQSVFSHTGPELVAKALAAAGRALSPGGLMLATFIDPSRLPAAPREAPGWTYPGCTTYPSARIAELVGEAGLVSRALPWWHPRQTWHAIALRDADLPPVSADRHLTGGILRDPSMAASLKGAS